MKKYVAGIASLWLASVGLPLWAADGHSVLPPAVAAQDTGARLPQAARVRVKDRAAAARAVAAAQAGGTMQRVAAGADKPDKVDRVDLVGAEAKVDAVEKVDAASEVDTASKIDAASKVEAADATGHGHADAGHATADAHAKPADAAVPASLAAACEPPFKTEIAALFERWNAALRSGDPKKVVAHYAPGSVLLPTLSNRVRFTMSEKEEYFSHFLKRHPEGRIDDRVIEVDCNSAVDSGIYTFRFGDGTQTKARYTFAWKRVDGEWLIASHHSSAMPEQPAAASGAKSAVRAPESPKAWVRFP